MIDYDELLGICCYDNFDFPWRDSLTGHSIFAGTGYEDNTMLHPFFENICKKLHQILINVQLLEFSQTLLNISSIPVARTTIQQSRFIFTIILHGGRMISVKFIVSKLMISNHL